MELLKVLYQALIWILYASNVWTHPHFQIIIKNLFGLTSSKNIFGMGYPAATLPYWIFKMPFLFIRMLLLFSIPICDVKTTFLPWDIIMHCCEVFFLLMNTTIIKLVLCACNFDVNILIGKTILVIFYSDVYVKTPSVFNSVHDRFDIWLKN